MRFLSVLVVVGVIVPSLAQDADVNVSRQKRILGGSRVRSRKQFPYVVQLEGVMSRVAFVFTGKTRTCGATLVHRQWVLTAAHCLSTGKVEGSDVPHLVLQPKMWHAHISTLHKYDFWHSILGFFGRIFQVEEWQKIKIHAKAIYIHPDYTGQNMFRNDVALIKLDEPAPVQHDFVATVDVNDDVNFPVDGATCTAVGWGCTTENSDGTGSSLSDDLYSVDLDAMDDCGNGWAIDPQKQMCAHRTGQSICDGDSGGPLLCRGDDGRLKQVGITSFGTVANQRDHPNGFTRLSAFADWIKTTIDEN